MKPRVFIGSSSEALDIAYAIQANLEFDADVTVWTQNIFQPSSNSLDDLLNGLENFDFGIFIFQPDDIVNMRNANYNVVRDNVIFELGLFFGKLGRNRVFFVTPRQSPDFHLPTDLLGVLPGKYDDGREDGNLNATLGPFCTQVRLKFKDYLYSNIAGLEMESRAIKKIAIERKGFWEAYLTAALLRKKMDAIVKNFNEVQKGYVFKKSVKYSILEFIKWYQLASSDIIRILKIAKHLHEIEMSKSWGEPGQPGDVSEIKLFTDKISQLCEHLVTWEIDLQTIIAPDQLQEIPKLMQGWTSLIIDQFAKLPDLLEKGFTSENIKEKEMKQEPIHIQVVFDSPANMDKIMSIMESVIERVQRGELINEL